MQQFRRAVLTILVLAAVTAALMAIPRVSGAARLVGRVDPVAPGFPPPSPGLPDPNTGEPDSGSGRTQPKVVRQSIPVNRAQYTIDAMRAIRWSSVMWVKRIVGLGE
jgi:hypothetical protein